MFRKAVSIVEALTAVIVVMGIATMLRLTQALEFYR
jgi:hypothetical protein